MEVIEKGAGRADACQRVARPVSVRRRTVPILTQRQRETLQGAALAAAWAALMLLTGFLEGSTWPM